MPCPTPTIPTQWIGITPYPLIQHANANNGIADPNFSWGNFNCPATGTIFNAPTGTKIAPQAYQNVMDPVSFSPGLFTAVPPVRVVPNSTYVYNYVPFILDVMNVCLAFDRCHGEPQYDVANGCHYIWFLLGQPNAPRTIIRGFGTFPQPSLPKIELINTCPEFVIEMGPNDWQTCQSAAGIFTGGDICGQNAGLYGGLPCSTASFSNFVTKLDNPGTMPLYSGQMADVQTVMIVPNVQGEYRLYASRIENIQIA